MGPIRKGRRAGYGGVRKWSLRKGFSFQVQGAGVKSKNLLISGHFTGQSTMSIGVNGMSSAVQEAECDGEAESTAGLAAGAACAF
jgi:hypothetical protein